MGFSLKEISSIIDAPDIVVKGALEKQIEKLKNERTETDKLIEKADQMIADLVNKNGYYK